VIASARTETRWLRVTRETPCPVCGHFDWCLIAADKTACICPRTESAKRCGEAGYLHLLVEKPRPQEPRRIKLRFGTALPDLTTLATSYREAATVERLTTFAAELSVSVASLNAFGVGWAASYRAWAFPLTDPTTSKVTGIRLRRPDGAKFSVSGGKESLFLPTGTPATGEPLVIAEGATDAIAAHGIGFLNAVGRPSCTGGVRHIIELVKTRKPSGIVVVADGDGPGTRGAETLASVLALHCRNVRTIYPPTWCKDLRDWVAKGATRAAVEQLMHAADVRRLNLTISTRGNNK